MHYCYLVETYDKPSRLDAYDGELEYLINPYYYENRPEKISWDWCEVGGRWSGDIPGNCCLGADIPDGFEPYGLVTDWGVIDKDWNDEAFWDAYDGMTQEERQEGIRQHDEEACRLFAEDYRIHPDRWYTIIDFHS